ncbi:MAG: nickel pincer cofactor biosynthesis protein LarC [bacterium]|nr:nickel pincer cofactor biosynthesis protein LarC [bacterium]
MKTLYLDCSMGAAGDMLTAALLELIPDPDRFIEELNALGIPTVRFARESSEKCGITGTHVTVTVNGEEEESCDVYPHSNHDHDGHEDHGHDTDHSHDHDGHGYDMDHSHDHDSSEDHGHDTDHSHDHDGSEDYSHGIAHPHDYSCSEDCIHDTNHHHDHTDGNHTHHHSGLHDIEHIVRDHLNLPQKVCDDVMAVYRLIAEAESKVHGKPVTEIHFHEVGTMDAVADIAAVCLLMDRLSPDEVVVSPIHVGSGQVRCAHGILPVPAPATAHILRDVPIYGGSIRGELCTPTGAALLKHFADRFAEMPIMKTKAIGYGMGKKDFEAANCIRAMWGETYAVQSEICELSCNVDDMTAEAVGFAMKQLFEDGALDVYTVPIGMKKSRPGILIHVMCRETDREKIIKSVFRNTTTIGIRENKLCRYVLDRRMETLDTPYGPVRCKVSSGYDVERRKYEYDDLSRIAEERNISIFEAESLIKECGYGER